MCESTSVLKAVALSAVVAVAALGTAHAQFTNLRDFDAAADGAGSGDVAVSGTIVFGTGGTLWSFDTSINTFTNLHEFNGTADGSAPRGVAVSGTTLFGTTRGGGANDDGTIWSFDTGTDTFTKLHDFAGADGERPNGVAISGATVFGTTEFGGVNRCDDLTGGLMSCGTIWSFDTRANTFTKLHDFHDGYLPSGRVAVSGTTVFGVTELGGANGIGTIWSFDVGANMFTSLHNFSGVDGSSPIGGVAVSDMTVFGTTTYGTYGGANEFCSPAGCGTIWSFDVGTNMFTSLHNFSEADGRRPFGGVAAAGEMVSGTAREGGVNGIGTIWSFDVGTNMFTSLHNFSGADGSLPLGDVAAAGDMVFGTAPGGGANGDGTLWSFDVSQLCGDFDMDGDVDVADRTIQTQNWTGALQPNDPNANKTFADGDCNGDGDVDVADQTGTIQNWTGALAGNLDIFRSTIGGVGELKALGHASDLSVGGTLDMNVVPEPSASVLGVLGLLTFRFRRKSSRF